MTWDLTGRGSGQKEARQDGGEDLRIDHMLVHVDNQTLLRSRGLTRHGARLDQHGVTEGLNIEDIHLPQSGAEQTKAAGVSPAGACSTIDLTATR
jgi:hypothetical protein